MSNLLDKASILLSPTAYNNGSMLSVKPTDGDGDFTFVRGSAATRVNAQGLVENVQIISSELVSNGDFSNGSTGWTLGSQWSIVNETAVLVGDGSFSSLEYPIAFESGKTYRVEFDVIAISGNGKFQIQQGALTEFSTAGSYSYDVTVTNTPNSNIQFARKNGSVNMTLDNISVKEVTDDTNLPRINYEGFSYDGNGDIIPNSGCGSWLLEPQSTNLYLNSETLVTQSNATSASTYTVSFYGSGSITFSGTHIGSLVGNGSDERVSVTFTATSGTLTSTIIGNVNKGQLEEQSFATSYIPTEAATNTRNQDIANNSGNSSLINSTEGVLYAEIAALANDGGNRIISLSTGSQSNRLIMLYTSTSNEVRALGSRNSLGQFDISFVTANALDFLKIAVKYKENDFALWVNGSEVATSNIGLTPIGLSELAFDNGGNGSAKFFGKTKCVAVYKEALTDAELQSLTTI